MDDPEYMKDPVKFLKEEDAKFNKLMATLTDETDRGMADFLYQDGLFVEDIPGMIADPGMRRDYLDGTLHG